MQSWQKICLDTRHLSEAQALMTLPAKPASVPSPVKVSVVRRAVDFLQSCIREQAANGDRSSALALAGVLEVLHGVSRSSDRLIRQAEGEAYGYIANYTELAEEAGASLNTLNGLWLVADVLAATDYARKEEMHTGQLCSYARVEEIYEMYYAPSRSA